MHIITNPNNIDRKAWSDFVYNHPHGNIFQTPEMYFVYSQTRNYEPVFIAIEENNKIVAILLAVIQKEYQGFLGKVTARSIITGGPLICLNRSELISIILKEYQKSVKGKIIYTQIRNIFDQSLYIAIYEKNKFIYQDHLNILLDLSIGESDLFGGFSKSRKKGIRKAQREEFVFEIINHDNFIDDFYSLLSDSYSRIKLPYPNKGHFKNICTNLNSNNYKIFSIKFNNKAIVALFALIYKGVIYGYYLGSLGDAEILRRKPIDLLFWEVFKWSVKNNIKKFDWMGAGKPDKDYGVREFKLQFGGELVNFGRYENIHNPFLFVIAKLGLQIWRTIN